MSGSGEAAADEDPGVSQPENEDNDVLNNSDATTEPALIEEEEMPTYMSLTSSSKPDESAVEGEVCQRPKDNGQKIKAKGRRASSPYASDDQEGGSVYVVSSGEESDRVYNDEDYESDVMELEDEEEDNEEDDSRPGYIDEEEDSEGDIETEQFERSSDDFVLRYDTGLEKHHRARSRSLQDLTNCRGNLSRFVGKRRSVDMMDQYNSGLGGRERELPRDPLGDGKKVVKSRYSHVPSKVKLYIQSIREQTRLLMDMKEKNAIQKNINEAKSGKPEVTCTRINPANRMIKGYAQNVLNAMMEQEKVNVPDVTYGGRRLGENGPEREVIGAPEAKQTSDKGASLEAVLISDNHPKTLDNLAKGGKPNGIIDYSTQNHSEKLGESVETAATNGPEQVATIYNLRTLSYEEYTNGDQKASNNKTEIDQALQPINEEKNGVAEPMEEEEEEEEEEEGEEVEIVGAAEAELARVASKPEILKMAHARPEESLQQNVDFSKSEIHQVEGTHRENNMAMLWAILNQKCAELNEKTAQYNGIRDALQKTLAENVNLKRELEDLKKAMAHQQAENKPRETSVASVQTDSVPEVVEETKLSANESKPPMPKLLSSSVGSALSSIEQWSDSNCSPAISINPPNMDHVLNSDDSLLLPECTPRRNQPRQLSHSFITSSRILQTLANITQGRTKATNPLANATRISNSRPEPEQGQSKTETESPDPVPCSGSEAARARKRKATDMLGFSNCAEPFKIPRTPELPRKKINSDSDTDGVFKMPRQQQYQSAAGSPDELSAGGKDEPGQGDSVDDTEAAGVPDDVKCFVYHEDESSKERSFLIQAEDPSKSGGPRGGGTVRECGPYLLGNVEIRMSEANGTINIWGKEISQDSECIEADEEETIDTDPFETSLRNRSASLDGQKTPRAKFVNGDEPFVCSTNKKSKLSPRFARSSIGKYLRPALSNLARVNSLANEEEGRYSSSPVLNTRTNECEQCESQKRRFRWTSCDHPMTGSSRRRQHSCCRQETEINEKDCHCGRGAAIDDDEILETVTSILTNHKKCDAFHHNSSMKHSCANIANEDTCRHRSPCRRRSNEHERGCCHAKKRCSSCAADLPSCNTRLTPGCGSSCGNRSRSHSHASSCEDDDHPLLTNGQCETPESKRRRLSGKKVRGILTDLLRGCGGCRDHNSTSYFVKESASLPNLNPPTVRVTPSTPQQSCSHNLNPPTVRITPSTPQQASCSKSSSPCASHSKAATSRDHSIEKCCSSCNRRVEIAAEIESKLELLTVEMERLRSRSDTFRGMLNLLNADTD